MTTIKPGRPRLRPMWVIYDKPRDYPSSFIARRWFYSARGYFPTAVVLKDSSVEPIREHLAKMGFIKIERNPLDDPKILECWI